MKNVHDAGLQLLVFELTGKYIDGEDNIMGHCTAALQA
jgi:hypothetical protein